MAVATRGRAPLFLRHPRNVFNGNESIPGRCFFNAKTSHASEICELNRIELWRNPSPICNTNDSKKATDSRGSAKLGSRLHQMENQIVCFLQHRFTMITFANHGYALDCNQKWWPMWNHQGPAPTTYLLPVPKNIVIRPRGQRCNKHRLVIPPCSSLHLQPPSTVTTWVQLTPNRQKLDRDVEAPAKMNGRDVQDRTLEIWVCLKMDIPFNGHLMRMILIIHWNWGGPYFQTNPYHELCVPELPSSKCQGFGTTIGVPARMNDDEPLIQPIRLITDHTQPSSKALCNAL